MQHDLRDRLVQVALEWEQAFGNAPQITSVISEYDAAQLVGFPLVDYSLSMKTATAVQRGHDFLHGGSRYQVKANRPSGKPGSFVTLVPKAKNYEWDFLIWILYDSTYAIQEAWMWEVSAYQKAFAAAKRLSPGHYRQGKRLM